MTVTLLDMTGPAQPPTEDPRELFEFVTLSALVFVISAFVLAVINQLAT